MTVQSFTTSVASGDNTVGHVAAVSSVGGAIACVVCWFFQLGHVIPPPEVEAAFGILFSVIASYVMQKLAPS